MTIVVRIVGTEGTLGKHRHHVVVHPVGDCDTERVATHQRRAIVEPGVDACEVHVLDDLVQARVVPRDAGEADARGRHVDSLAAAVVLDRGDAGWRDRAMSGVELGMAWRLAERRPVRPRVEEVDRGVGTPEVLAILDPPRPDVSVRLRDVERGEQTSVGQ